MLTQRHSKLDQIRANLSQVFCYVELCKSEGMNDSSKELEDFCLGLLNIIYGYTLVNLNETNGANFPAVDLGSENDQCSFQISSNDSKQKVTDSLKAFELHNLHERFGKIKFLIFSMRKKKPDGFNTEKVIFSPETDILYINDLYHEMVGRSDLIDVVLSYFEKNLSTLIKIPLNPQSIEIVLFKQIFTQISQLGKEEIDGLEESHIIPDDSDLNKKKETFKPFWDLIEANYRDMMDTEREKIYSQVESSFGEGDLISLKQYLKLNSRKCLHEAKNNPIKAIELLKTKIIDQIGLSFVSDVEVEYFLYYQMYYCFVFPN